MALVRLNPPQQEAVRYLDGPCLVLAGAGSGKTRVITQKMAYLLEDCAYSARHVVALTFTNKAAREMNERVRQRVPARRLRGLTVGTFHSLGLRFLREEYAHAGLKRNFSILDAADTLAIIQDLLATTDRARLRAVQQTVSLWKNALLDPEGAARAARDASEAEAARVYRSYAATLRAYQSLDFDDLIRLPAQLLAENAAVRARWQLRVQYLLVDEYQDTNVCQYQIVRALCGDRAMFTAVGDDDQAIYAWRGATAENLARLARDFPALRIIKLEQNYRSVQRILQAANRVIAHNPKTFEKALWSDLGAGDPIGVTPMETDQAEAESIALRISAAHFERRAAWRDFAVLYRGNHQARVVEQALRNLHIPYTVSGGQSFFDKTEVRDVLAWLRLVANEDEDPAFIRAATTPRRGIGQSSLQALGAEAARRGVSLYRAAAEASESLLPSPRARRAVQEFVQLVEHFRRRAARQGGAIPPLPGTGSQGDLLAFDVEAEAPEADRVRGPVPGSAHESSAGSHSAAPQVGLEGLQGDRASRVLDDLLAVVGYERYLLDSLDERQAQSRWSNVLDLVGWLKGKAEEDDLTLAELVQHVALVTLLERSDEEDPDAVKLSTLHAAKGLEFPHVYLIGVEEGLLPHRSADTEGDVSEAAVAASQQRIQEERRLMYVGITRAKQSLQISWCRRRRRGRDDVRCEPSRFIAEMGLESDAAGSSPVADPERTLNRLKALLRS